MTELCTVCGASIVYVISEAGADTWGSQSEWQHRDSLIDLDHYAEAPSRPLLHDPHDTMGERL